MRLLPSPRVVLRHASAALLSALVAPPLVHAAAPETMTSEDLTETARAYQGVTDVSGNPTADGASSTEVEGDMGSSDGAVVEGGGLFEQSIAGTTDGGAPGTVRATAAKRGWGFDLGGYVRGDMFIGKVPGYKQGEIKAGYGELSLKARVARERYGSGFAEARLRFGQQGDRRDIFVDLREAYVDLFLGPFDLRLGNQIIVWGRADALNPTNNLTPTDWRIRSPIEDDRRMANVGARMFLTFAPVRIEGVWMPLYSPIEYPTFEPIEGVDIVDPDFPPPYLNNGLYAGRLHLELSHFEASASYLFGHALLPGLSLEGYSVGEGAMVRVARKAYKHHVAGVDFSTAIKDILAIRGEVAFRYPLDYDNQAHAARPDLQYALGLDRAFGPVTIIGQYLGRYVVDWEQEDGPTMPLDVAYLEELTEDDLTSTVVAVIENTVREELAVRNQILFNQLARFQHLATVRIEWLTLHETLSLSALGMVNFTTWEWLLYPKIGYKISDHISAYVGGEIYMGPDDTLLGWIDEILSAGYAELRFSF